MKKKTIKTHVNILQQGVVDPREEYKVVKQIKLTIPTKENKRIACMNAMHKVGMEVVEDIPEPKEIKETKSYEYKYVEYHPPLQDITIEPTTNFTKVEHYIKKVFNWGKFWLNIGNTITTAVLIGICVFILGAVADPVLGLQIGAFFAAIIAIIGISCSIASGHKSKEVMRHRYTLSTGTVVED